MYKLVPLVDRLTKAPLKPQKWLFALKVFLLPKLYRHMVLGRVTISSSNEIDKMVRGYALPKVTLTAYFHAPVAKGGLGIPSLRWMALFQRGKRLLAMLSYHNIGEVEDSYLPREIVLCTRRLACERLSQCAEYSWARLLHNKIEGKPLREYRRVPRRHGWVGKDTMLLSRRSFIWAKMEGCPRAAGSK